jgi:hypothetical protein
MQGFFIAGIEENTSILSGFVGKKPLKILLSLFCPKTSQI